MTEEELDIIIGIHKAQAAVKQLETEMLYLKFLVSRLKGEAENVRPPEVRKWRPKGVVPVPRRRLRVKHEMKKASEERKGWWSD